MDTNNNIASMQKIFDNNISMNQNFYNNMQNNPNNLYTNNFNQTWQNMQQKTDLIDTNMNNMLNILCLINFPVVVPYHSQHPLVNCFTPERAKKFKYWICDKCQAKYTLNVPSFYCTACDFDLCQKCFLSLGAYQIVLYNYLSGSLVNLNQEFRNSKNVFKNIHNHPMVIIKREKTYFAIDLKCNKCLKDFKKDDQFYYCSLCNFCVCEICFDKYNQNFFENEEYFD